MNRYFSFLFVALFFVSCQNMPSSTKPVGPASNDQAETKTLASTPLAESYYPYLNHPQQISLATNKVVYLQDFPEHPPRVYVSNLDGTEKQMVLDTPSLPLSVQYINLSGPFNFLIQSTGVHE